MAGVDAFATEAPAGINAFRTETLANQAQTTDAAHSFRLRAGQKLVHMSIAVGAASGPVHVNAWIYNEGDTARPIILGEADWIRADRLFGAPDVWIYQGRTGYQDNSTLRIHIRNDTGSTITWIAAWRTEP